MEDRPRMYAGKGANLWMRGVDPGEKVRVLEVRFLDLYRASESTAIMRATRGERTLGYE